VDEESKRLQRHRKNHRWVHTRFARPTYGHGRCHKPLHGLLPDCSNNRELQQGVTKLQELEVPLSQQDPV
jgi:hypothetical protein